MDLLELLLLGTLGVIGGVISGLVGVGGGIVFVPALIYAAGMDIQEAVAASLVIIIFASLSGTLRNLRSENPVDLRAATLLSLTVAPSALIGVAISRVSSETVVEAVFALVLLAMAYPTARGGSSDVGDANIRIPTVLVLIAGVGIGTLSGLVGVGGGVLMVPLMVLGLGLRAKVAIATSLAVVFFTGIFGTIGYVATGFDNFAVLPPLVLGSIAGAWLSVRVRNRTPDRTLRILFAAFMVAVAAQLLLTL